MQGILRSGAMAILALALTGAVSSAAGRELTLVQGGVSQAPIVIFKDAPPLTRKAADELAQYIEKTCGAKMQVIEGMPQPMPEKAIWVGYQPALKELFPKVDFDFKHPEEILVVANEKHLVIAGRDRWDSENLVVQGRGGRIIEGRQQEYGTCNAVYTFLQDHLGVRWLWPGELGEDIFKRDTLAFAPFEYRYHPVNRSRGGVLHYSKLISGGVGYGRSFEWVRLQRLQLSSLDESGGHAFGDWFERFHKTHPEWFALQPDGTRSGFPAPKWAKLCHSNPAVAKQWLADVEELLKKDPNRVIFNATPNDGWGSGHCVCDNCRAWDHPDGELRNFRWRGISQQYVALSDREVTFANECAKLLKERFPDKDYYVLIASYGHSRPAPIVARPATNVIISSVANFLGRDEVDRGSTRGDTYRQQYEAWTKVAPKLFWRPNTGSPAGWQQGQPDVSITQTIKDFQFVGQSGCMGIFIDAVWEHWATQGPMYYVMAHLTWNPHQDGQAILEDYYQRGFGTASKEIKAYWQLLEDTREQFVKDEKEYWVVYDKAFFDKAYGHLDRATAMLAQEPEIYRKRVEFVRAGLDYTKLVMEVRELMARIKQGKGKDAEAEKTVRANWAKMEQLCKDHPYAINWLSIRPITPRMASLHPDYYKNAKKEN